MVLTSYNQKTTLHLSGYYFHQVILIFKVTVTVRFKDAFLLVVNELVL